MGIAPTIAFLISAVIMIAFLFALWYVLFRKPKSVTITRFYGGSAGSAYMPPQRGGSGGVGPSVRPLRDAPRRNDDDYPTVAFYDGGYVPIDSGGSSSGDSGSSGGSDGGGGGD